MVNGLVDFGGNGGVGGYAGAGIGRAKVKQLGDSDNAWACQLLAGVYMPISDNVDVGLKYRYFRTGKLNFNDESPSRRSEPRAAPWRAAAAPPSSAAAAISARTACSPA